MLPRKKLFQKSFRHFSFDISSLNTDMLEPKSFFISFTSIRKAVQDHYASKLTEKIHFLPRQRTPPPHPHPKMKAVPEGSRHYTTICVCFIEIRPGNL